MSDTDTPAWLVICLVGLGIFSTYILLAPSHPIALILDIIDTPTSFRLELLVIAIINILACFSFERYAERPIAKAIAHAKRALRRRRRKDGRGGGEGDHQYKIIEGNMR